MVVAVQPQFAARLQKLASVDDEAVTRSAPAKRMKGALDLCAVRLDDDPRIADVLLLCQLQHERPPDLTVERLRIDAELIVDFIKIALRNRRREIVDIKDLYAHQRIDRIRTAVCNHRRQDADVRPIIALHTVVGIDAPRAERLLPEKRCPVQCLDMARRGCRKGERIGVRRVDRPLAEMEILPADKEIRQQMDAENVLLPSHLLHTERMQHIVRDGKVLLRLKLLQKQERPTTAHIIQKLRQRLHRPEPPRREENAAIGGIRRNAVRERTALERLAFLREDRLHIVP